MQDNKTLSVKVPPGVDNGDRIRLAGEGEAGANGDLREIYMCRFRLRNIIFLPGTALTYFVTCLLISLQLV